MLSMCLMNPCLAMWIHCKATASKSKCFLVIYLGAFRHCSTENLALTSNSYFNIFYIHTQYKMIYFSFELWCFYVKLVHILFICLCLFWFVPTFFFKFDLICGHLFARRFSSSLTFSLFLFFFFFRSFVALLVLLCSQFQNHVNYLKDVIIWINNCQNISKQFMKIY